VFVWFLGVVVSLQQNVLATEATDDRVTAEDIALECERRAVACRQKADELEKVAGIIRGVLALPGEAS
jgi:hypothetical protein